MKKVALIVVLLSCAPAVSAQRPVATAALSAEAQRAVDAYRTAVLAAEAGGPGTIEKAFTALATVRDVLMQGQRLESLSDDAYTRLVSQLRGVIISRRETEFVQPDVTYYAHLANTKGDAADKAFFTALKATYPESVWPVYLQRQSDTGGCARFGSLSLVESYAAWAQVKQRFPARYAIPVEDEIEALFELLTDGTCACGTIADVEKELTAFDTRFPMSSIKPEIDERLKDIRGGKPAITANCRGR